MAPQNYKEASYPKMLAARDEGRLRPTRHLKRTVLCGFCRFRCCNHEKFEVELTPDEVPKYNLPVIFPQNGSCPELTDTGCKHAVRPAFCRMFPLTIDEQGRVGTSYWVTTQCPGPKHFVADGRTPDGRYIYRPAPGVRGPVTRNMQDVVYSHVPIEEMPTILEVGAEAYAELLGEEALQELRAGLAALDAPPPAKPKKKGFGLSGNAD